LKPSHDPHPQISQRSFLELKKATWPWDPKEKGFAKYRELNDSTIVVFIAMILLGAFVAFFDFSFKWAFEAAQKIWHVIFTFPNPFLPPWEPSRSPRSMVRYPRPFRP
jgi:preprotein translocase subunit SecE